MPPLLCLPLFCDSCDGREAVSYRHVAEYESTQEGASHAAQVTLGPLLLQPALRVDQGRPRLEGQVHPYVQLPALQDWWWCTQAAQAGIVAGAE